MSRDHFRTIWRFSPLLLILGSLALFSGGLVCFLVASDGITAPDVTPVEHLWADRCGPMIAPMMLAAGASFVLGVAQTLWRIAAFFFQHLTTRAVTT
jgi:hypothetical protein